ncbi:hypothetical protein HMPREF1396_01596 [Helicobacter pylori GAM114Ai]|nr:hypothetical protein HMPREF1396_01596 [Helicobacter pylori GAM114Ai]EMG88551.1 hypothetical protein HMPREF1395_00815 [Helicobacter pylori GAM112Ai]EMG89823.1 hypothetical protein HMPREF1397_00394 [Helicobacter pylori GAM115Ai]EMH34598.1 hypothetical protein HMPREF1424_00302 [Helicobacter pylori GAM42Ai]EMJ45295.1 hypothetical protein HMPREF1436_00162 [Helicobacter pylori GAMchJs136i]
MKRLGGAILMRATTIAINKPKIKEITAKGKEMQKAAFNMG